MKALIWYECKLGMSGEGGDVCWDLEDCELDIIPEIGTAIDIEKTDKTGVVEAVRWRLVMDEVPYTCLDVVVSTIKKQDDTLNDWLKVFDKRGGDMPSSTRLLYVYINLDADEAVNG